MSKELFGTDVSQSRIIPHVSPSKIQRDSPSLFPLDNPGHIEDKRKVLGCPTQMMGRQAPHESLFRLYRNVQWGNDIFGERMRILVFFQIVRYHVI